MARVTVEDCVLKVPNRFELVMMAAQRAREIAAGAQLTLERDNDKNPVVALREIADEGVPLESLRDSLVRGHQRHVEIDETEEEIVELMAGEEEEWRRQVAENAGTELGDGAVGLGSILGADDAGSDLADDSEAAAEAEDDEAGFADLDGDEFDADTDVDEVDGDGPGSADDFTDEGFRD